MSNNQTMFMSPDYQMRQQNQNFNLDYANFTNQNQPNPSLNQNTQPKTGFASIFSKKSNQNIDQNNIGTGHSTESQNIKLAKNDNLNVDLSKLGFAKDNDDSNSLLPNFITDNFKNKK